MAFDAAAFDRAQLVPRTSKLPVPGLARWFTPGSDPVWTVRGLNAVELHHAAEASKSREVVGNIFRAVGATDDQVKNLRVAIGIPSGEVPGEVVKRQEWLRMGSVDPVIDLSVAVKLSELYPAEFMLLTNEIMVISSQGATDLGKPEAASTPTTASPSA